MTACAMGLISVMLAAAESDTGSASDVFAQIRANIIQVRSAEFDFVSTETRDGKLTTNGEQTRVECSGHVWFEEPWRLRVEYRSSDLPGKQTLISNEQQSRTLVVEDNGVTGGQVANGGISALGKATLLGVFIPYVEVEGWRLIGLKTEKWSAHWKGKLIRLSGAYLADQMHDWDVDPQKGFSIVAADQNVSTPLGIMRVFETREVTEALPSIWFPRKRTCQQILDGKLVRRQTSEIVADTLKVNQPISADKFQLTFPKGTHVSDVLKNAVYYEGGQLSRDRESVTQLADAAQRYAVSHPVQSSTSAVPKAGAIVAPADSQAPWSVLRTSLVVAVVGLIGSVFLIWWRR